MKRLEVKNEASPNFIGNWDLENEELCNQIIDFFENNSDLQTKGTTGGGVDESIKKSTDMVISGKDSWKDIDEIFFISLSKALAKMKKEYDFFNGKFKDIGYAIQRLSLIHI